jgi:hypothetical protein
LHVPRAPAAAPVVQQHIIVGFEELGPPLGAWAPMHTKIACNFRITIFEEQYVCQTGGECSAPASQEFTYAFDFYRLKILERRS